MNDSDRKLVSILALGSVSLLSACRKADESALGGGPERSSPRSATAVAADATAVVANAAAANSAPEPGAAADQPAAVAWTDGGTWVTSDIYDFKLEGANYCARPQKADAGEAAAGPVWLGVRAQVAAKTDELFVDRRHATLRDKGIYFQATLVSEPL